MAASQPSTMPESSTADKLNDTIQPQTSHLEDGHKPRDGPLLKSSFDELGLLTTVKKFWKVCTSPSHIIHSSSTRTGRGTDRCGF